MSQSGWDRTSWAGQAGAKCNERVEVLRNGVRRPVGEGRRAERTIAAHRLELEWEVTNE